MGQQRKKHADLQEKTQGLWSNSKLFEKALACFKGSFHDKALLKFKVHITFNSDSNDVTQLSKHLLRTVCSELTNMMVLSLAEDSGLPIPENYNLSNTVMILSLSRSLARTLTHTHTHTHTHSLSPHSLTHTHILIASRFSILCRCFAYNHYYRIGSN